MRGALQLGEVDRLAVRGRRDRIRLAVLGERQRAARVINTPTFILNAGELRVISIFAPFSFDAPRYAWHTLPTLIHFNQRDRRVC